MSFLMHHKYGPRICVIICLGLIYLLSACSTPEIKVVKEYHPVLVEVPSPLLNPIPLSPPPEKQMFMAASDNDKLIMLTQYSVNLMGLLKQCNLRFEAIRQHEIKVQQTLMEPKP